MLFNVVGCKENQSLKLRSIGSPGEVLIVTNLSDGIFNKLMEIDGFFNENFPALPQSEKLFKVIHISAKEFTGHLRTFRNVLYVRIDEQSSQPLIRFSNDRWAQFQNVVEVNATSESVAVDFIINEFDEIKTFYYSGDVKRMMAINRNVMNESLNETIRNNHSLDILLPKGYRLRKDTTGFAWLQYDNFETSMGILIYDSVIVNINNITVDDLIEVKKAINKKMIRGDREGSYMTCEDRVPYISSELKLNGRKWTEVRGLWKMEGDMMGGAYTSLFTVEEDRLIVIDAFLYAPSDKYKAPKMRLLDAIVRSAKLL